MSMDDPQDKDEKKETGSSIEKMTSSPDDVTENERKRPASDLTTTGEEEGSHNREDSNTSNEKNNDVVITEEDGTVKVKDTTGSNDNNESDDISSKREAKRRRTGDDNNDNNDSVADAVADTTTADSKPDDNPDVKKPDDTDADADAADATTEGGDDVKKDDANDNDKNAAVVDNDNKNTNNPNSNNKSSDNKLLHYEVLGDGEIRSDGRKYYSTIRVKWGNDDDNKSTSTILRKGTFVYLNKTPTERTSDDWICCIHEFYRDTKDSKNNTTVDENIENSGNDNRDENNKVSNCKPENTTGSKVGAPLQMRAYWLLRPKEVAEFGNDKQFEGGKKLLALLKDMKPNEVLLTNIDTDHDVGTIQRVCNVSSSSTSSDTENDTVDKKNDGNDNDDHRTTSTNKNKDDENKKPDVICRYKLFVDTNKFSVNLIPYQVGDEDDIDNMANDDDVVMEETADVTNTNANTTKSATTEDDVEADEQEDEEVDEQQSEQEADDDEIMEEQSRNIMQEGEGSTLRGDILVGPKYQMDVKPFNPNNIRRVKSRNPKLVWTSDNTLTDDQFHEFLSELALIHTKYLRENNVIILNEPYTPLKSEIAEQIMRENLANNKTNRDEPFYLTGSSMSSASRLVGTTSHRNTLLRECDVDKVLELLHEHQYDTTAALDAARRNLYSISTIWGKSERDEYDAAFRLHPSSALREISQFFKPESNKSLPDIIDYHYRFKLPDQFRKLQDKKMEQSIKMIEVIENRKSINDILGNVAPSSSSTTNTGTASNGQSNTSANTLIGTPSTVPAGADNDVNNDKKDPVIEGNSQGPTTVPAAAIQVTAPRQQPQWFEKPIASIAIERDERIRKAKKLLLDVREILGPDVVKDVAGVVRKLQVSYDPVLRDSLFLLLRNQPELQNRFSEFLPRLY